MPNYVTLSAMPLEVLCFYRLPACSGAFTAEALKHFRHPWAFVSKKLSSHTGISANVPIRMEQNRNSEFAADFDEFRNRKSIESPLFSENVHFPKLDVEVSIPVFSFWI
jgi:hypothetical protein